jgi:RimJ/RimL family protein N-acetyltransferase
MNRADDVPVVETDRLILRGHRLEDFPAILEMWRDPAVTRFIGGKPRTEEDCWLKFLRAAGFWRHLGYGYWVAEEKGSGAVVGELGFGDFKRDLTPSIRGEPEAGWALAAPFHGKGYASEAALAIMAWGDDRKFGAPMSCIIEPENKASIRIAEKCGFSESAKTTYHGDPLLIFHRR